MLAENHFETVDIFEQQASVGGAWNHTDNPPPSVISIPQTVPFQPLDDPVWYREGEEKQPVFISPVYDDLETNIPHFLMQHSDMPFPSGSQLFPPRESVSQYLEEYAHEISHLIHFKTQVLDVQLLNSRSDKDTWLLARRDLVTGRVFKSTYDAVAIASGHYTVPFIPDIEGISEWNIEHPGRIQHSKLYRRPEAFKDKKVVVVGNSASALDIGAQIGTVCRHPLLVSIRSASDFGSNIATYKEVVPEITEFLTAPTAIKRAVRFADGRIEEDIDIILFCTGYFYSFPFIQFEKELISDGTRVRSLYQHMFYINHTTLAFLGLPMKITPFPVCESQAAVVSRVWSGRLKLPSATEMFHWEAEEISKYGEGKRFHTLVFPRDLNYMNTMADWAMHANPDLGKKPPRWSHREAWMRERFAAIKKAFAEKGEDRHNVRSLEELGFDYDAWAKRQHEERSVL